MKPTLAAEELRRTLTQYLSTTFALADQPVRESLERFLNHPGHGIFKGPYLRLRTPFRQAEVGWTDHLEWWPEGFEPYRHQAKAFARLSTRRGAAEPTLITTGTGSGKTESFLIPVLDHCRRERARGRAGVKAILLYPMNALATDQAERLNALLAKSGLGDVEAGLYIGDEAERTFPRVRTDRYQIRDVRPDILITNYKMLDLLLQRKEDAKLWHDADLAYVVVDEFHTYDGAQGTDVAMLIRRLAAATGHSEPGRPLGRICPVATSATLGERGDSARIREVAWQVFGTDFPEDAVVGEDRLTLDEFVTDHDYSLPLPSPAELMDIEDPQESPNVILKLAERVTGEGLTGSALGAVLKRHILTSAVIEVLGGEPYTLPEILELLPRKGAYSWGAALRSDPRSAAAALARFVALLSVARDPLDEGRPLLHVETHVWVRSVSRLLREVAERPAFGWYGEPPPPDDDSLAVGAGRTYLPAVYCRHCGRSGWTAISPEQDPTYLVPDPERIYRVGVGPDKKRVRPLIHATRSEAATHTATDSGANVMVLEAGGAHVRPLDLAKDFAAYDDGTFTGVFVLTELRTDEQAGRAAEADRCPACAMDQGIRYLGAGVATLASVAITELFTGGELDRKERKTLLFNDAVQDAAHRAGFVANRSYGFSLRSLLATQLSENESTPLNDLIGALIKVAATPENLPAVVPPDLQDRREIDRLLAGEDEGSTEAWDLIGERLAFSAIMEFGLRSRQGRTLELTRTAAAEVALAEEDQRQRLVNLLRDLHRRVPGLSTSLQPDERYVAYLRGLLERLRMRGGVKHHWLDAWIAVTGTRRYKAIWGKRPDGLPAFPHGLSAPTFLIDGPKRRSEFDDVTARGGWYQDWTMRCLRLDRAGAAGYLAALLPVLAREDVISARTAADGSTRVYGLQPGHIQVQLLGRHEVNHAGLLCERCGWEQTIHPGRVEAWKGHPCPRYRCAGTLDEPKRERDRTTDYYRALYLRSKAFKVVAAEHTGQLDRRERERVESRFRDGRHYNDPNVLSCTPTLELGIDIGDLSAVILASLPRTPANYVQRAGRAGRRSGNAFVLTMIGRSSRERYFLADPRQMIAGQIVPPGCYLSAVEILRRQYFAHLVDLAARDRLPGGLPLPARASELFGESGWLRDFAEAALSVGASLAEDFLALFGDHVNPPAAAELLAFATSGLAHAVDRAKEEWESRKADLEARRETIAAAMATLVQTDRTQRAQWLALRREDAEIRRYISEELGRAPAQNALVELGLLPNYSLLDSATRLEATLILEKETAGGDPAYEVELREYDRSARYALTELAPGNYFYVRGFRHHVTGLDVGSPARQKWTWWRVCPDCGYIRTNLAEQDTSSCPRCRTGAIGDSGQCYKVLQPLRVTSRDRRDDAVIRDDSDERDRCAYEHAVAVDIEPGDITMSWRRVKATFGVDYTRHAVIRRFNLGVLRTDRPAGDAFAGEMKRVNPFYACTICGGTRTDGPPVTDHGLDPLISSSPGATNDHHRPWCPQRTMAAEHTPDPRPRAADRSAAHPTADRHRDDRRASGVLRGGFDGRRRREVRGDPQHLDIVTATMPDHDTGRRRQFLVLHDRLPGGTGYLHWLSDHDEFKDVLVRARHIIETCPCAAEGNDSAACHRCLLSRVHSSKWDKVRRDEALGMLTDLLDGWATEPVSRTDAISLWDQVESELEARFLDSLLRWAGRADSPASFSTNGQENGRRIGDLRVAGPDGSVVHWRMALHNVIEGTAPDVWFSRLDSAPLHVAVYLDGYRYHAAPSKNRIADDAEKRARLRAHGHVVFQITWDDLDRWRGQQVTEPPVWPPYQGVAQQAARGVYERMGGNPADLNGLVWANPLEALYAFLGDPDLDRWRRRAEAVVAGILVQPGFIKTAAGPGFIGDCVVASLQIPARQLPSPDPGGNITLVRAADGNGCPVTVIVDQRRGVGDLSWTAFVVIDDRDDVMAIDEDAHRRRWMAWLYWGNLLQFLAYGGGDAGQLAHTGLDHFDPTLLAVANGTGLRTALSLVSLEEELSVPGLPAPAAVAPTVSAAPADEAWAAVFDLLDPDEPGLASLARSLAERGVPAPQAGYELGDGAWQAELAWPDEKLAVVLAGSDEEATDRNAAYEQEGWHVRDARTWSAGELAEQIVGIGGGRS